MERALNDKNDHFASINVEVDKMESLKDDPEMMK